MTISAQDGPTLTRYASAGAAVGFGPANANPQQGPNYNAFGDAVLDPRYPFTFFPGGNITDKTMGFLSTEMQVLNCAPATLANNNISASASPGAGAIVLVSTTGAGITAGVSITRADTGTVVTGLLAIDGPNTPFQYGQDAQASYWDPRTLIARAIRYVSGGNDSGITFTCTGFDVYGYPMTETVTGANAGTATGLKAWKYITSITHTGSVAGTLSIGTTDVFGLPIRADGYGELKVFWDTTYAAASTGFVAAVTTNPNTAVLGDVRGTYLLQATASNGTRRLVIYVSPQIANMQTVTGLFGVTQFGSNNNGT